jgi:hypothetical protein
MNGTPELQKELFTLLEEFFERATGKSAREFASLENFSKSVPSLRERLPQVQHAFDWALPRLFEHYGRQKTDLFKTAQEQGGLKVVLGGSSHFGKTQLNTVRRLILYADTVLIPDPVFSLLEAKRPDLRFQHVQLLETIFFLLRLKPVVDADLGYPPLILFPSYERLLAVNDPVTRSRMDRFQAGMFSQFLSRQFSSVEELIQYVESEGQAFINTVAARRLFVAPGGPIDEPLDLALERYRSEIKQWRTEEYVARLEALPKSSLLCNAILERLEPQYHLIENATEMRAQPLLSVEQQAYYFHLCASATEDLLQRLDFISPRTRSTIEALGKKSFEWLSNVPIGALVEMRVNNENEKFRERLSKATSELNDAGLADLDRVANEISHGIGSLLNEHRQSARKLEEKYKPKFVGMAAKGWATVGALLMPYLTPLIATVSGLGLGGSYLQAKLEQRAERRELASSLIGVLATAASADENIE